MEKPYRVSKHTGKRLPSKSWLKRRIEQVQEQAAKEIELRQKQQQEHLEGRT